MSALVAANGSGSGTVVVAALVVDVEVGSGSVEAAPEQALANTIRTPTAEAVTTRLVDTFVMTRKTLPRPWKFSRQ